jgi:anti-sigma regulatory factor (Ser/Thr protein kinase)
MTAVGPEAVQPASAQHCIRTFPARPEQVRQARTFLKRVLAGCPAADDAVLCLSELAANACLHSNSRHPGGRFTVRVQAHGPGLRVEVSDQGGPWTTLAYDNHQQSGRGLRIVGQLARTWGRTGSASTGWTTWFEIGSPPAPRATPQAAPEGSQRRISMADSHQLRPTSPAQPVPGPAGHQGPR